VHTPGLPIHRKEASAIDYCLPMPFLKIAGRTLDLRPCSLADDYPGGGSRETPEEGGDRVRQRRWPGRQPAGKRLGHSPGKGDAVVMAWSEGEAAAVCRHNARKWERKERPRWIV